MSNNHLSENVSSMPDRLAFQLATREIARYADLLIEVIEPLTEEQLWGKAGGIPNAIGTLVRHLTGNLNHYFGAGVLENGYVRDRDREFIEGDIPKGKMLSDLRAAVEIARKAAEQVTDEQLQRRPYRTPNGEEYESLAYHATRNAMHFALHYGQVDYAKNYLE
ncbi:MAG: DinB family protein [Anaerolineae bacterium]|nr:DinB family protein [Anaerolineae bacterium]